MFGTLVIQLPSNYTGGQLVVYHQSKSKKFDFSGPVGCTDTHYAAFYADCQHEIEPVTKGYRLCLVYNLVCRGFSSCPSPPDNEESVSTIISSMKEWAEDREGSPPAMMTYLLEHQYCEASLCFQLLKNSDRAVANVLLQARKEVSFGLYVGMVKVVEMWDENEDEHFDTEVTAEDLKSYDGLSISSIDLKKDFFVPEDFFEEIGDYHIMEFIGNTGNEAATVNKQYNWAALLLWPSKNNTQNLGFENAVELLNKEVHDLPNPSKMAELEVLARDLLRELHCDNPWKRPTKMFFQALQAFNKAELVLEFFHAITQPLYPLDSLDFFINDISTMGCKYGWDVLKSPLLAVFNKMPSSSRYSIEEHSQLLLTISQEPVSDVQRDVCQSLASVMIKYLCDAWLSCADDATDAKSYIPLLHSLQNLGEMELISQFLGGITSLEMNLIECPLFSNELLTMGNKYGWDMFRQPLLTMFSKLSSPAYSVEKYCEFAYKLSQEPTSETLSILCQDLADVAERAVLRKLDADNWLDLFTFSCPCEDCAVLMQFFRDPMKTTYCFKLQIKRRYKHLRKQLSQAEERPFSFIGSYCYKLKVIKKTNFKKDCQKAKKDKVFLHRLLSHLKSVNTSSGAEPVEKCQKMHI